jgi:Na+/H+-dicarboxylate symporter
MTMGSLSKTTPLQHASKWRWLKKISLNSTSVQLLLVLLGVLVFGSALPLPTKMGFYTLSLFIKETLLLLLPFVVFSCLFKTLLANKAYAFKFVGVLLVMVVSSNILSTVIGYGVSHLILPQLDLAQIGTNASIDVWAKTNDLLPWIDIHFDPFGMKSWFNNKNALIMGLVLGLLSSVLPLPQQIAGAADRLQKAVNFFLTRIFIPVLPFFVLGFVLKMQHEGKFMLIFKTYVPIILLIAATNTLYIALLYAIASKFNLKNMGRLIKNMLPAGLAGFTTMSSIAAMPVTLKAVENNVAEREKPIVRAVIPATVNIHLIGDSIAITTMALAMLLAFGHELPTLSQFWHFVQFFVVTKFSVATIPGGSILAMLPVLEQSLGFSSEMLGFITAVYILFDPLITGMNVMGNGAFALFSTHCLPTQANLKNRCPIDKDKPAR